MNLKDLILYSKVLFAVSIVGSVYLIYRTKEFYFLFVFSVTMLALTLVFEYVYERFLQNYEHLQKKKMSIEALSKNWVDEDEIRRLKEELEHNKNIYKRALERISKEMQKQGEILQSLYSFYKKDTELEGADIKEPIVSLDKVVGWNEKDKETAKIALGMMGSNADIPLSVLDKKGNNEISKIIEENKGLIKGQYIEFLRNGDEEKFKEFLELYEYAKKENINFDINGLIHGIYISETETLRNILNEKYKNEVGIDIENFFTLIKVLAVSDEPFVHDGRSYKKVVFVYKNCVYVNFVVIRHFFSDYDDEKESIYANIFKDYLCSSIDWKRGYLKRNFELNYNGNRVNVPFVAFKRSSIDENLPETPGVKIG